MEGLLVYMLILIALPLAGFVGLSLFGKRLPEKVTAYLSTFGVGVSLALSLGVAWFYFSGGLAAGSMKNMVLANCEWLRINDQLTINMGIGLDAISVMMLVVITAISFLVHLYSAGYMHGEERLSSYFAYLQLFTFSMLGLVISVNIFQIYFFWELVGVSSFLLIGFFCTRPSAIAAAKKAFIVTRFADLGFLIGILLLGGGAQTFDFQTLILRLTDTASPYYLAMTQASFAGISMINWAMFLVFIGGAGKSAVFPFHVWLPDAMEGPTPVSALIHAATMVVAGVFLVARLFPIYAVATPDVLLLIGYMAAFTALFAAIIACTQTDLKKVLAYSTISQIAYMLLALGVSQYGEGVSEGFTASMFHLFTHAFFKAALFLCAGVVIHAVATGELKDLGGLSKALPITRWTFLIAALSISGVPFFSGFFSKEMILAAAYQTQPALFAVALLTSGLTAFYMFRIYFLVFHNHPFKGDTHHLEAGAEKWQMALPLIILAIGSVLPGYIDFGRFVSADGMPHPTETHLLFSIAPVLIGLVGISIAYWMYYRQNDRPAKCVQAMSHFYQWAYHKFYIDAIYLFFAKVVMDKGFAACAQWIDQNIVLRLISWTGLGTLKLSYSIRRMQSGRLQSHGYYFLGGVIFIALVLILQYL